MPNRFITGVRRQWRKRFGVLPLRSALRPLSEWFASPLGQLLVDNEQACIDNELRDLFGYHLLQLSVAQHLDLTQASRISHRFALYPQASEQPIVTGVADFTHLPLPANSIDLVLLHHVLDYSQKPHQVLREAASALISQGHLVVIGFNPWSLFGAWRWLVRFFSHAPQWRHQSLRLGRVLDWLAILDFEPIVVKQSFYCPPCHKPGITKYLQWMERWGKRLGLPGGGFYLIVARKDSLAVTPLKPQWQGYAGLRGWGVTKILGRATRGKQPQAQYNVKK
ncbi:methyltransferase type 11 [Cellvibrio zantedeschiae]|uniref:Methyltransferase type 11 n=1 Tax=Cellvibrio zantedeschiae TaxID=1237077 RepID=A0ABQ3B2R2_9GAMM|nr:methyltransferase domain-containing protein [Cellvibrio zantedeschiae]GGY71484.1 methyltransferase type 11 [Cellvibrio zantedeschiae]